MFDLLGLVKYEAELHIERLEDKLGSLVEDIIERQLRGHALRLRLNTTSTTSRTCNDIHINNTTTNNDMTAD